MSEKEGFVDLVTDEAPSTRGVFDGVWGRAYDRSVKQRRYSAFISPLWQGASSAVMREMFRLMDEAVTVGRDERVLDVPCGGGPVLLRADGRLRGRYVGADLSPEQLRRAAALVERSGLGDRVELYRADARSLPFEDASFDRVCTFNGLHLIPERAQVLKELARVLRPGGELVGSTLVPSPKRGRRLLHPWFFCLDLAEPQTRAQLEADLDAAGFPLAGIVQNGPIVVLRADKPSEKRTALRVGRDGQGP